MESAAGRYNDLKRTAQHSLQLDAETGAINSSVTATPFVVDVSVANEKLLTESGDTIVWELATNESLLTESGDRIVQENGSLMYYDGSSSVGGAILVQKGLVTAIATDPQVMLRWSDDGGHTWSNEHWRSMGLTGEWGRRVIWRRLGMTLKLRDRVYEVSGTDQVKIAIMGAELDVSATNA